MREEQLNIRHLAAMLAVVQHGGASAATKSANLSQPAITQGILKLEAQLGLPLFDRHARGMTPTPAAGRLAPRVQTALRLIGSSRVTAAQMRAFLGVARAGGYAGAAAHMGLAEPSLHRAVGDLSVAVGQRLVERRGRGVVLTTQGALLARRFRLALSELRSALNELAELQGRAIGRIAVGAMPLSRARIVPNAIIEFRRRHPDVDIAVVEGPHAELVGPLRDGEIDLMIGALRDPSSEGDLVQSPLVVDRPSIMARAGHPLRVGMTANDLARFSWIVPPEGTPLRALWTNMFVAIGQPLPRVPVECGSVMTIRQLLIQGDFLTLLSADQVMPEVEAGWLIDLGPPPFDVSRTIGVTTRADWRPTKVQEAFVGALRTASEVYPRS